MRNVTAAVTHYFFDLINGSGLTRDEEGMELESLAKARKVAIAAARSIMAEEVLKGMVDLTGKIVVRTNEPDPAIELGFEEALKIKAS